MYQTNQYEGMIAETVTMQGHKGETINAYMARPIGAGPFPGNPSRCAAPWAESRWPLEALRAPAPSRTTRS